MTTEILSGKLSAVKVKQAKPKDKTYKLSDGKGLNLEVRSNGSKYWRLYYRHQNKQKTLALGVYPVVTLSEARKQALEAKRVLHNGVDPNIHKRQARALNKNNTFRFIAEEWHKKASGHWSKTHAERVMHSIKSDVLPYLSDFPITDIKTHDVLHVIRQIEERGALDVASRVKQRIGAIFRYAIQTGYVEHNPVDALKNVIQTRRVQHRKSLELDELPSFLKALDKYQGYLLTRYALQIITHTFVRPGELRSAEWKDIDLDNAIWRIPAEKMKMNEEHIVPLSKQVIKLLEKVSELTGKYNLVFPSIRDYKKTMSENTLTYAIRKRLLFDATAHGFRTTASTILNETGYRVDVIERQLAHGERDKVRAAYNRSQYLAERTEMMQWYSDYLDGIKIGNNVISINRTANL